MKKIFLVLGVFILFGCNEVSAKSDFYKAVDQNSVADTVDNLSELSELKLEDKYDSMIGNKPITIWELGGLSPINVISEDTNLIAVIYRDYPVDFIETLITDYGIDVDEKMLTVLDRDKILFEEYEILTNFNLEKHAIGIGEDNTYMIVLNKFGSNGEDTFQRYDAFVVFDEYALEQWKQVFLADELYYEQELQDAHDQSVTTTDGAYQEWYDAMIKSGRDPKELQQQNKNIQDAINSQWD